VSEITELLARAAAGEGGARERLYTLLYAELQRLARSHLAQAGPITLDPSAIVHEVWLRNESSRAALGAASRGQFFAHASTVMRSVIVDHVRARAAGKRGGGLAAVTLSTGRLEGLAAEPEALRVDEALQALARIDERCHRVVEMRYFGGMSFEAIAEVMDVSVPTLKRDWRRARAFLFDYLSA
jgi:RNA polymerase sigma factor (TIGR02999 family)